MAAGALASLLAAGCGIIDVSGTRELQAGRTLQARIGEQPTTHVVRLRAGESVRVLLDQHDEDLAVRVTTPDRRALPEVDVHERGVESATILADVPGLFTVDVRAAAARAGAGTPYDVRLERPPQLTQHRDRLRRRAEELASDGRRLASTAAAADHAAAVDRLRAAARLWRQAGDAAGEAVVLALIGDALHGRGEVAAAKAAYVESLALSRQVGDRRQIAELLNNIGVTDWRRGVLTDAMRSLDQALAEWRTLTLPAGEAATLTNQGNLFFESGDYQDALDRYLSALKVFQEQGDASGEAFALNNIGVTYGALGDFETALAYLGRSLPRFRAAGDVPGEGRALIRLGEIQLERGEVRAAAATAESALPVIRRAGDPLAEADLADLLGQIANRSGDRTRALAMYADAVARYRASERRVGEATALYHRGTVLGAMGEFAKARDALTRALTIRVEAGLRDAQAETLYQLALVEWQAGSLAVARMRLRDALALTEEVRGRVAGRYSRTTYFAARQDYFETYIELLMQLHARTPGAGFATEAFETSERQRARSLLDVLEDANADLRRGVDPALLAQERDQRRQLDFWSYRLAALVDRPGAEEQAAEARARIGELVAAYRETQGRVRAARPRDALTSPRSLSVREIQRRVLDVPGTVLLRFVLGARRSYVWVVTPGSLRVASLPPRAEIEPLAHRVHELVSTRRVPANAAAQLAAYQRSALALSAMLLDPIAAEIAGQRLLIVCDGALQLVPFAALPAPETEVPLVTRQEIVMLPSASALDALRRQNDRRAAPSKTVAVLADPVYEANDPRVDRRTAAAVRTPGGPSVGRLPFSRFEGQSILGLVPEAARFAAFGFDANREGALGPGLQDYRIVHFAAHAIADYTHPELSGIVLSLVDASGAAQDGVLRLHDISDSMRLRADLVVLSACQTAIGKDVPGEGVMGLAGGFFAAGAMRVVASLYKVEDEATAELMRTFYEVMLGPARLSPAAALRQAQISMHAQPRWRDPYWWSAFVLLGEPR